MDERMNGPKKIIADIDNTLWDLAREFRARLTKINPQISPPSLWGDREFWERYLSLTTATDAGILRTGLLCPWNEKSGHPLFKNLIEVLAFIQSALSISKS